MPMDMEEDPRTMAADGGIMEANKKMVGQDHTLAYITIYLMKQQKTKS